MKDDEKTVECPKCGSRELGKGKQSGYSAMHPTNKMSFGSTIEYLICTECGYIIEGYVKKPKRFKGTIY